MLKYFANGQIGTDITAIALEAFIMSSNGEPIELVIDSGGGYVDEAFKMAAIIAANPQIHTKAIFVASAANLLFLAAKRRVAVQGVSTFGIHNCWATISGNANELEDYAQEMRQTDRKMADFYASTTGTAVEVFMKYMNLDTSQEFTDFNANTALSLNFATELEVKEIMAYLKPNNKSMQKNEKKPVSAWDKILSWAKNEKAAEVAEADAVEVELEEPEGDPEEFVTYDKCKEMIAEAMAELMAKMEANSEAQAEVLNAVLKKAKVQAQVTPVNKEKPKVEGEKPAEAKKPLFNNLKSKNVI